MSDLRKRANTILFQYGSGRSVPETVDAMLAFAAEQVAAETARCAKVCRDVASTRNDNMGFIAARLAEAIEKSAPSHQPPS